MVSKGLGLSETNKRALYTHISAYPEALNGYNDYFDMVKDFANILLEQNVEFVNWEKIMLKLKIVN